jgi:hypothetical protein
MDETAGDGSILSRRQRKPVKAWSRRRVWIINVVLVAVAIAVVWLFRWIVTAGH